MSAVSSWLARLDAFVAAVLGFFAVRTRAEVPTSDEDAVYHGYSATCFAVWRTYDEGETPRQ
ncbi:hypothetical protein [Kibdelosporangium aridum]|uniref:Uncharacterized protein n=1 Tax=Kibdelosporangium aridum TaxID=2030 RepID=A0A1W2FX68_KIBAR|nr:hypothetical protein [Kibdelosporangium aridum]SMD26557.1 hypothetical protein SAMN05661093_10140 [Kibdelosporangium aridum]